MRLKTANIILSPVTATQRIAAAICFHPGGRAGRRPRHYQARAFLRHSARWSDRPQNRQAHQGRCHQKCHRNHFHFGTENWSVQEDNCARYGCTEGEGICDKYRSRQWRLLEAPEIINSHPRPVRGFHFPFTYPPPKSRIFVVYERIGNV